MSHPFFMSPFNKTPPPNAIHPLPSSSSRKRKRSGSGSDDVLDNQSSELSSSSRSTGSSDSTIASLSPLRAQQLKARHRANKRNLNLGILGKNIPNVQPGQDVEDSVLDLKNELQYALGGAEPRLLFQHQRYFRDVLVRDVPRSVGLRQQHLAALTIILHKCILEGDYTRAGRAWGILLRAEVNGHIMDVRTHDRWGFGAEILSRQRLQPVDSPSRQQRSFTLEDHSIKQVLFDSKQWFSSEGFEQARGYYERLILQHPYQTALPNAVGASDFYPAMFGLWIYAEQEKYESSLKSFPEAGINLVQDARKTEQTHQRDLSPYPHAEAQLKKELIKKAFLRRCQEIAARLDELLVSPPFSDSARLGDLQCMVNKWIEDFSITTLLPGSEPNSGPEEGPIVDK
ncbi:hypothetical protein MMC29_000159 [Sticta canariensis]|nr:hypothetical protein [Sticta canariensis]